MVNARLARRALEAIDKGRAGEYGIFDLQASISGNVEAMEGVDRSLVDAAMDAEADLERIAFLVLPADQPAAIWQATQDLVSLLEPIAAEEVDEDSD